MKPKSSSKHPSKDKPMLRDYLGIAEMLKVAFGPGAKLVASPRPSGSVNSTPEKVVGSLRSKEVMQQFLRDIDWIQLDDDITVLQEFHTIISRQNDESVIEALGRVIELLEDMVDTGESCRFK